PEPVPLPVGQPQDEVGEAEVGDDLPVRLQQLEPGDVVRIEVRVGTDELGEGQHAAQRRGRFRTLRHARFAAHYKTPPTMSGTACFGRMRFMPGQYWKHVVASGLEVPQDRPLDDLTAELTRMLGDTD